VTLRDTTGEIEIRAAGAGLHADMQVPDFAIGLVVFAHASATSRQSPRNRRLARHLREQALGTLLLDLLTEEEESADASSGRYRFDAELLAMRLTAVTEWLRRNMELPLPLGYFGANTGAAAAIVAATRNQGIAAIVSRGGRPDLAGAALDQVRSPTLLILGSRDRQVLELNQNAFSRMHCEKELVVVPGATHLFEEPGALDKVAGEAARWFLLHFLE
jgi:putative phosphoribosyl transferase